MALSYCTSDTLALVGEIAGRRLRDVVGKAQHLNGGEPISMSNRRLDSLKVIRRLHLRFLAGDYRMTSQEWGTVKSVGSWLHRLHCQNQSLPIKDYDWSVAPQWWALSSPPPGSYQQLAALVRSGALERSDK